MFVAKTLEGLIHVNGARSLYTCFAVLQKAKKDLADK